MPSLTTDVTTGPEHITRNTKWQKEHRGVLLKIFLSILIIGFACNFTQGQPVSLISIFSILFKAKKLNFKGPIWTATRQEAIQLLQKWKVDRKKR